MTLRSWPRFGSPLAGLLLVFGLARANNEIIESRMKRDIFYLASDELEGRGVGTKGIDKAAEYIAQQFEQSGLKPGGTKGSWFQPFTMVSKIEQQGPSKLILRGPLGQTIECKFGTDFQVMGLSGSGKVTAPLVFAGYGATAKEIGYDDYKGLNVANKIVVVLRHTPRWSSKEVPFDGPRKDEHAGLEKKTGLAEVHGAAGLILLNDATEDPAGDKLMPFGALQGASGIHVPALHVRRSVFDTVFNLGRGERLLDIERAIDRDLKPRGGDLRGWTATIEAGVKRTIHSVKNVIGILEGKGPLAKETIVVGAHYDHLGYGGRGSRAKNPNNKEIHNGADDNASGTTAVIELARRYGAQKDREGRRLVFIAWSAEESGLLGSRHYCNKEPLTPLADTAAYVNLDMVGRLQPDKETGKPRLLIEGSGTAKTFDKLLADLNTGFHYVKKPGGTGPSDHDSFYRQKIPVIFFWTGTHEDYHRPTDDAEKINIAGMRQITDLSEKVIDRLAADPKRPEYVYVASTFTPGAVGKGPKLGIMPNYDENQEGVLVGGLSDDGPAAKGGIKVNDLIVEIAGKQVKNINNYMVIMAAQKSGQTIEVGVLRGGKKVTLKVTPK